jgi:F-type H+-transporting ATPase subunit b
LDALGINLGYILLQIFMFAIVFVTLKEWVYKPVLGLLDRRRKAIAQGLEDARVAAEARANAEQEAGKILAEAQAKAAQVIHESTERAEIAAREVRAEGEAEIYHARQAALAEVEQERNRVLGELRSQVAALAVAAAEKIMGETLDERRQRDLLQEFFSGIRTGRVTLLESASATGGSAEVTSALPLTPEEEETVKRDVLRVMGSTDGGSVSFRVDPDILGGLVVRVGDKVMDGSVVGQLQGLKQSLS